jgi:hypothetical protein
MKLLKVELTDEQMVELDRLIAIRGGEVGRRLTRTDMVRLWIYASCPITPHYVHKTKDMQKELNPVGPAGEMYHRMQKAEKVTGLNINGQAATDLPTEDPEYHRMRMEQIDDRVSKLIKDFEEGRIEIPDQPTEEPK